MNDPNLDPFTQAYIEAIYFTEEGTDLENEGTIYKNSELAFETWQEIIIDCNKFQQENAALLEQAYNEYGYSIAQAGHDFWLTRNGHGVGFWDRDLNELGDKLTAAADEYGECYTYLGDNGLVYIG